MVKLDDPSTTKVGISSIKPRTAFAWTDISTVRLQKLLEKIQWYVIVIIENVRLTNGFHVPPLPPRGVLPYMAYKGMCRRTGYVVLNSLS